MCNLIYRLWKDDGGALIAIEWVFVATILVFGAIVGLVAVRQAVVSELTEFANAVMSLNQGYKINGQKNCQSSISGSETKDSSNKIEASSSKPDSKDINSDPCN